MSDNDNKVIIVFGHGPGISDAVARRFGREGFRVALVARNAERLERAAAELGKDGITAKAFPCDVANAEAVTALVKDVRQALGPVSVLHWNAYVGSAGDPTTCTIEDARRAVDVSTFGMIAAVQAALPDLKTNRGAVLVTGGGFAFFDPKVDAAATSLGAMGLAVAKAAQKKATGLLHQRLKADGIFVGEVVVMGMVKGTAFDHGNAALEAKDIAQRFWTLHQARDAASVHFP